MRRGGCRRPARATRSARCRRRSTRMLASLERAREAERRFVADASHELRTPLTALRGNAAYIAQHGANAEVLADIEGDAARLAHLLDDLLALAREDAAGPQPSEPVRLDELALARAAERVTVDAPGARDACAATPTRSPARSATWSRTRSCTGRRAASSRSTCARAGGRALVTVQRRGPRARAARTPSTRSSASGAPAGPTARPARGSGSRSCARRPSATAAACASTGSAFTLDLPALGVRLSESSQESPVDIGRRT